MLTASPIILAGYSPKMARIISCSCGLSIEGHDLKKWRVWLAIKCARCFPWHRVILCILYIYAFCQSWPHERSECIGSPWHRVILCILNIYAFCHPWHRVIPYILYIYAFCHPWHRVIPYILYIKKPRGILGASGLHNNDRITR